ncbi:L-aspartate oxidase [Gorillibacterium timonense]|uniref:L-aspartate oxidase n=1 Tax=Gorillibacterium timonense TaxID=1689269 RepID=UPI00071C87D0|nr:L-aspartate oxidase [Gorillibacterium timonense]
MIPRYLTDVSWQDLPRYEFETIIIGSGVAGLYTAIKAAKTGKVLMITKKALDESNTRYAQGGIAAVIADEDSPDFHLQDTLMAGAGLCDEDAVDVLVHEGPARVNELIRLGTEFDLEDGVLALTREGAHSQRRILHAHGDSTGAEIVRALAQQALEQPNLEIWNNHFAIDLLTSNGECLGALVQRPDGSRVAVFGKATILCSGGAGQLYRYTTNPEIATADGIAIAYRAGAEVRDMEFVQFHPTSLCYPGAPRFLISEAVRGEGAVLRNSTGERFMENYHPLLELAPRDVVARAIVSEMERTKSTFVYLDITHEPREKVLHRFPMIYETCLHYGLDLTADWIPVAPAAHYMMGGVKTGLDGETSLKRLFACGEVSSTGVHGANRLASNSLSEALVFGRRIIKKLAELPELDLDSLQVGSSDQVALALRKDIPMTPVVEKRLKLQKVMLRHVGLVRSDEGLERGIDELRRLMSLFESRLTKREEYEFANMLTVSLLVAVAARMRQESRGGHFRSDYPASNEEWRRHIVFHRESGTVTETVRRMPVEHGQEEAAASKG